MSLSVIILAAGQGSRMGSTYPKVLQILAGKPLLHYVLETSYGLGPQQTLVVRGYKGELLQDKCKHFAVDWVWQNEQLGTGHAVQSAYQYLSNQTDRVLVLYGDVPLIRAATLQKLLNNTPDNAVGILTAVMPDAAGFGRIIRDKQNNVISIVEEKDATEEQIKINEINTGIYVLPYKSLNSWLAKLQANNNQKEYYLTDIIAMAVEDRVSVLAHTVENLLEVTGVNSQQELANLERAYQKELVAELMISGVKVYDPSRLDIRGKVHVGLDVSIDVNVILQGVVELGDRVTIGPNVIIANSEIAAGTVINANSVIDGATIGPDCQIGPFARIRPGTNIKSASKIGNFVEVKNSCIDEKTKINHLSYVGDAIIGKRVNIGAGVITCNFDGASKHTTIIEDEAFIGSNCELVAPVVVGKGATLAAGTTLIKDAPAYALTLTKKVINSLINWQRPIKQKEEA